MSVSNDLETLEKIGSLAILEALGDAVSIQDNDLKVLYQNPSHRRLMGDHVGRYCYEAYQKRASACPGCHLLKSFKSGKVYRREAMTEHSSRGLIHVEIISTPLKDADGKIVAGIEAVRDITERKLMTEKLNAITSDLEQRTWRLMAVNKELESFSYTLSHDIRNYIARISMASQALKEDFSTVLADKGDFLLSSIDESCSELERFVEAILQLCSSGRGENSQEPVDLSALAKEVAEELFCQYPEREVTVDIAPGLVASGDR
jgi:signal transduction histidine kinase